MKIITCSLLVLLTIFALSASQFSPPTWTNCPSYSPQWYAYNVTVEQNPSVKEVITISACGSVASAGWYTIFYYLFVNGSVGGSAYTWNNTIPLNSQLVSTGGTYCLNHTTYVPSLNKKDFNVSLVAISGSGWDIGCVNIYFQNQTVNGIDV